ncbi:MAG: polysaccharide export protein [Nevskia sp.]|nr:polysaccharide export protein [Nevskia sp.]
MPKGKPRFRGAFKLGLIIGTCGLFAGGCSQMPVNGPMAQEVVDPDSARDNTYVVIDLTPSIVRKLQNQQPRTLSRAFGDIAPAAPQRIGIGDTVSVSIWEAGSGGLFFNQAAAAPGQAAAGSSAGGAGAPAAGARYVTLPNQMVDLDGQITVPYAGRTVVNGMDPAQAQARIEAALNSKALQPQVLLSVVQTQSNVVTVSGDVGQPGRIPLFLQGSRILDVIAQAGGSKWAAYDTTVQLTRNGVSRRVPLGEILANPAENIFLQGGDMVHLLRQPQTVAVLGSTSTNALVPFDTEHLTLAEALAKSGGLNDNQADAKGVFVFRFEPADVVRDLIPQTGQAKLPELTPVVFRANLGQGGTLFLTQAFAMNDKDVVYVADAQSVQLIKLIGLLRNTAVIFQARGAFVTN